MLGGKTFVVWTLILAAGPQIVFGGEGGTYWLWYAVLQVPKCVTINMYFKI